MKPSRLLKQIRGSSATRRVFSLAAVACLAASLGALVAARDAEHQQNRWIGVVARQRFQAIADDLHLELNDWAHWDQMQAHAQGRNPDFAREVYTSATYQRTPLMVVFDRNLRPVSGSTWDASTGYRPLAPAQLAAIQAQIPERAFRAQAFLGIWQGTATLFMLEPILDSEGRGSAAGLLLFGRQLGPNSLFRSAVRDWGQSTGVVRDDLRLLSEPASPAPGLLSIPVDLQPWSLGKGRPVAAYTIVRQPLERQTTLRRIGWVWLAGGAAACLVTITWLLVQRRWRYRLALVQHQTSRGRQLDSVTGLLTTAVFFRQAAARLVAHPEACHALMVLKLDQSKALEALLGADRRGELIAALRPLFPAEGAAVQLLGRMEGAVWIALFSAPDQASLRYRIERVALTARSFALTLAGQPLQGTCSAGIAFVASDQLLRTCADRALLACAAVQQNGGAGWHVFGESIAVDNYIQLRELSQDVVAAMAENRLVFAAQQAWDLSASDDFRAGYVELLVRLRDAATGRLSWSAGYSAAMAALGNSLMFDVYLVPRALDQIRALMAVADDDERVFAVNLSLQSLLAEGFIERCTQWARERGLPPARLCFEVLERSVLVPLPELRIALLALKAQGFKVALDDFGSGSNSLAMLWELPLDYVKVDRALVQKMSRDSVARMIIQTVIELGYVHDYQVIAEGIEAHQELFAAVEMGFALAQGYLATVPVEIEADAGRRTGIS